MAATATPTCTAASRAVPIGLVASKGLIGARNDDARFQNDVLTPERNGMNTANAANDTSRIRSPEEPSNAKTPGARSASTTPIASTGKPRDCASIQISAASGDDVGHGIRIPASASTRKCSTIPFCAALPGAAGAKRPL